MQEKIFRALSDRFIRFALISAFGLFLIQSVLTTLLYKKIPTLIPFFNNMAWGEERLAPKVLLVVLLFLYIFIIITHNILAERFYEKYPLLSRIVSAISVLFVALGFFAFIKILFLVF